MDDFRSQTYNNLEIQDTKRMLENFAKLANDSFQDIQSPKIEIPTFPIDKCEKISHNIIEKESWEFGKRPVYLMNGGYSGQCLKASSLKIHGNISEKSYLYLRENLFCEDCFGYVEAKNIVANNVGHSRGNPIVGLPKFLVRENLIVNGKTFFANIDAWNAEFKDLVDNTYINIGRLGVFHSIGKGTNIKVNPNNSYLTNYLEQEMQVMINKLNYLQSGKDFLNNEITNKKRHYQTMASIELDRISSRAREKVIKNKLNYEKLLENYKNMDSFLLDKLFHKKIEEVSSLIYAYKAIGLQKAKIFIKKIEKPSISISFGGQHIEIPSKFKNIILLLKDNKVTIEDWV
jgi:hypothetical protein